MSDPFRRLTKTGSKGVLARVLLFDVTSFVETQAGRFSMAARGRPPQLSQSYRDRDLRASWYLSFSDGELESDDTDPDDLDALHPVTEYVGQQHLLLHTMNQSQ